MKFKELFEGNKIFKHYTERGWVEYYDYDDGMSEIVIEERLCYYSCDGLDYNRKNSNSLAKCNLFDKKLETNKDDNPIRCNECIKWIRENKDKKTSERRRMRT